jgi:integrase/recombinase XerD
MLDRCFARPHVPRRLRVNPLADDLGRLAALLLGRGHSPETIQGYLRAAEHFGRWLGRKRLRPTDVNARVIGAFLDGHLPRCKCSSPAPRHLVTVRATLRHLLHLGQRDVRGSNPPPDRTAVESIVQDFDLHMRTTCGLAAATRHYRLRYAREFLQGVFGHQAVRLNQLAVGDAMAFVTNYARRCSPATAQVAASALRSFLRFLLLRDLCDARLPAAVPHVPQWPLASVPRTLSEPQLKEFLACFDRSTPTGRRDYAMALCMVDLGLRVSDVAQLRLCDINWRQATLRIAGGKPRRCNVLPLLGRVGQAVADHLRRGRPRGSQVQLFLRHRAPVAMPVTRELIRGVMRRAYARCGFDRRWTGTHVLRHTAASRMLQRGATLKEIADILGHRSINTSAIYSKVNITMLASVALPWPEVLP